VGVFVHTNQVGPSGVASIGLVLLAAGIIAVAVAIQQKATTPKAPEQKKASPKAPEQGRVAGSFATGAAVLAVFEALTVFIHGNSPGTTTGLSTGSPTATASSRPSPSRPAPAPTPSPSDPCSLPSGSPPRLVYVSNETHAMQVLELYARVTGDDPNPLHAQEYLHLYGRFATSALPHGDSFWVVASWDNNTFTFFLQKGTHRAGDDIPLFSRDTIQPDASGCFDLGNKKWGNPGTFGLGEEFTVLLATPAQATVLAEAEAYTFENGTSKLLTARLETYGKPVAKFEVATNPYETQEGTAGWILVKR
jgi:hypothetical protein